MKRTEKKRKQKKVVLICTLATAAVIVGGMTFAWYTAKDEVTNRFTANANFGASIVEEFAPPTDWQPGATVEKKASVVNTGTVDAFVRAWLTGEMRVVVPLTDNNAIAVNDTNITNLTALATDPRDKDNATALDKLGLVQYSTGDANNNTKYVKTLDKTALTNPDATATNDPSSNNALNEVQAIQAGGHLAYFPENAEWVYTYTPKDGGDNVTVNNKTAGYTTQNAGYDIDSDSFKPKTTGLYLFRRNMDLDGSTNDKNVEYSGYYYVAKETADEGGQGTYYALRPVNSVPATTNDHKSDLTVLRKTAGGAIVESDISGLYLFTAQSKVFSDTQSGGTKLTWAETNETDDKFSADRDYSGDYLKVTAPDTKITAYIKLANLADATEQWKKLGTAEKSTFYYNNDLESGDTTTNFVESVTLNPNLTQNDFLTFDFDLNVNMDSVQVTTDTDGKELTTSAQAAFSDTNGSAPTKIANTAFTPDYDANDKNEIAKVTWTATNP